MKRALSLIFAVLPFAAFGQVVWTDNFDSMSLGSLNGQGGWSESGSATNIVGTVGIVSPFSGTRMATQQPTTGSAAGIHLPTGWSGRTVGNDILSMSGAIYVTAGTQNLGSAIIQVIGIGGSGATRMGFAGIANNSFIYGTGSNLFTGPAATMNTWHVMRLDVDTVNFSTKMYADNVLIGSDTYDPTAVLNNWGFQSTALFGPVSNPVFFDSMQVAAVPEPVSMAGLAVAGLALIRRRSLKR